MQNRIFAPDLQNRSEHIPEYLNAGISGFKEQINPGTGRFIQEIQQKILGIGNTGKFFSQFNCLIVHRGKNTEIAAFYGVVGFILLQWDLDRYCRFCIPERERTVF